MCKFRLPHRAPHHQQESPGEDVPPLGMVPSTVVSELPSAVGKIDSCSQASTAFATSVGLSSCIKCSPVASVWLGHVCEQTRARSQWRRALPQSKEGWTITAREFRNAKKMSFFGEYTHRCRPLLSDFLLLNNLSNNPPYVSTESNTWFVLSAPWVMSQSDSNKFENQIFQNHFFFHRILPHFIDPTTTLFSLLQSKASASSIDPPWWERLEHLQQGTQEALLAQKLRVLQQR